MRFAWAAAVFAAGIATAAAQQPNPSLRAIPDGAGNRVAELQGLDKVVGSPGTELEFAL